MQIGNKFRCYPNPVQEQVLLRWIGCQRNIYNSKVREDQYFHRFARKSLQHTGEFAPIDQQYSQFKTELTPYLSEVPSVLLRNGAVLWKQAYGRYFSKLGGRPTIHKKHGKQAVWLTSELFKFMPVTNTDTGEITDFQLHILSECWFSRRTRNTGFPPRCISAFTPVTGTFHSTTMMAFQSQPTKTQLIG